MHTSNLWFTMPSPHKRGTTIQVIHILKPVIEAAGIEMKMVNLYGHPVRSCTECGSCIETGVCVQGSADDPVNEWFQETVDSDGLILACPTSFANGSTEMLSYIDRVGYMCRQKLLLKHKYGAAVVACNCSGDTGCFNAVCLFFFYFFFFIILVWSFVHSLLIRWTASSVSSRCI